MKAGDRFHAWVYRNKSPLCAKPDRDGLYAIERAEQYADAAIEHKPTSPELLAYVVGIGRACR